MSAEVEHDAQTYAVIGAAMEVHSQLGHGLLEAVYQDALEVELTARGIPFEREIPFTVRYKGIQLSCAYRADFICYRRVLVEIKALSKLGGVEQSQVINYLKATGLSIGLLLNFGAPKLEYKRIIYTHKGVSADGADVHR